MTLAIIPVMFAVSLMYVEKDAPIYDGDKYLAVGNTSFEFVTAECGQPVALIGTIENKSDKAIGNVVFDVEYYGKDGKVIDVASDQQYDFVIPPRTSKSFKVSSGAGAKSRRRRTPMLA